MKVLFATYPMAFHTPGGGEIQLKAYQKHLELQGVEVSLFDPWNPRFEEFDLIHFFSCIGGSVHFCAFVKQLGIPLVVSSSLWITEDTRSLYPCDEIRCQLSFADYVVTNSDIESEELSKVLSLPREKFATVYNGIDSIFFDKVSPELFLSKYKINSPFVLNVGNIEPRKNQLSLARAMKSYPETKLVLIGHVRDSDYAKKVMEEGGDQVVYLGAVPHGDELLRSAYAACNVFCLPSTLETPGLAAIEAAACGSRLLLTRVGATQEYFGADALYVDPLDIDSIRSGLRESFELTPVPDSGPDFVDFEWSAVIKPLVEVYRTAINDNTTIVRND